VGREFLDDMFRRAVRDDNHWTTTKRILSHGAVFVVLFCALILLQVLFHVDHRYNPDGDLPMRVIVSAVLSAGLTLIWGEFSQ
jgi:hypothetical protein